MGRLCGNEIPPQNVKNYRYLRKGLPSTFKCRKVGSSSPCTQSMLITTKNCNLKMSVKTVPKPKKAHKFLKCTLNTSIKFAGL